MRVMLKSGRPRDVGSLITAEVIKMYGRRYYRRSYRRYGRRY